MARVLLFLLMLALAVSLLGALLHLLLVTVSVVVGIAFMVFLFHYRRLAFWSLVLLGGVFLLTKIGPWGLAALGIWLFVEAVSAAVTALRRRRSSPSSSTPPEGMLPNGSGAKP
jgi:hypothetical protein